MLGRASKGSVCITCGAGASEGLRIARGRRKTSTMLKLYNFHSSSASYRVRIALNLKRVAYENVPVTLRWKEGDQEKAEYRALNPQGIVPLLVDGETKIGQSIAIFEYLDHLAPEPLLFPKDPSERARVMSLALYVACEIQPLNNLRVEKYLSGQLGIADDRLKEWRRNWIRTGFDAIEELLKSHRSTGRYCHGDQLTAADCCLVPQVNNALRPTVDLDLSAWPTIKRIFEACLEHPAVDAARPQKQPGYEDPQRH
jgi:maleylpyruvate isomerase